MESLAEDLVLLAIDPSSGVIRCFGQLRFGLMGAELVALAAAGRVTVADGRVTVADGRVTVADGRVAGVASAMPASDDSDLDAALAKLRAAKSPPRVRSCVARPRRSITNVYLARLVAAGTIQAKTGVLRPRCQVIDQARAEAVRARLDAIALGQTDAGGSGAGGVEWAGLAEAIGLGRLLYRGKDNKPVRARLRELSKSHWAAEAVRHAVAAASSAG